MTKPFEPFLNAPKKKVLDLEGTSSPPKVPPEHLEKLKELEEAQQAYSAQKEAEAAKTEHTEPEPPEPEEPTPASADFTPVDAMGLTAGMQDFLDSLVSEDQEVEAEKQSTKLDFGDMAKFGEFRQTVKINSSLSATFRTISSQENLEIHKRIHESSDESLAYLQEKMALYSLTCSLREVNGKELPNHMVNGSFDSDMFEKKFKRVMSWPIQMNAMLCVHAMWFDKRVRRLFKLKKSKTDKANIDEILKNG